MCPPLVRQVSTHCTLCARGDQIECTPAHLTTAQCTHEPITLDSNSKPIAQSSRP